MIKTERKPLTVFVFIKLKTYFKMVCPRLKYIMFYDTRPHFHCRPCQNVVCDTRYSVLFGHYEIDD